MSDVMLHGVLRMPPELWRNDHLDRIQRHGRYLQASQRIYDDEREIERLRAELDRRAVVSVDEGKLWSMIRSVLYQGQSQQTDRDNDMYPRGPEEFHAHVDVAARKRVPEFLALLAAAPAPPKEKE